MREWAVERRIVPMQAGRTRIMLRRRFPRRSKASTRHDAKVALRVCTSPECPERDEQGVSGPHLGRRSDAKAPDSGLMRAGKISTGNGISRLLRRRP